MSKLEFKDIPGYEGYYKVNRNGDIYNIKNNRKLKHQFKKDGKNNHINAYVSLFKNGKKHDFHVGTIVGRTFINKKYYSFSHKDGDFTNNNVENLEIYCIRQKVILHLPNGTIKTCNSLQAASKYLGYNINYLSAYLSTHHRSPYVFAKDILICYLEFKEGDE